MACLSRDGCVPSRNLCSSAPCEDVRRQWLHRQQGILPGKALQSRGGNCGRSSAGLGPALDPDLTNNNLELSKLPPLFGLYFLFCRTTTLDSMGLRSLPVHNFHIPKTAIQERFGETSSHKTHLQRQPPRLGCWHHQCKRPNLTNTFIIQKTCCKILCIFN